MTNKKARGKRAKTRHLFKNYVKPTVNNLLGDFEVGQQVVVNINSSVHAGLPHKRFQGLGGTIVDKQGKALVVSLKHGNMLKSVVIGPVHVKSLGGARK